MGKKTASNGIDVCCIRVRKRGTKRWARQDCSITLHVCCMRIRQCACKGVPVWHKGTRYNARRGSETKAFCGAARGAPGGASHPLLILYKAQTGRNTSNITKPNENHTKHFPNTSKNTSKHFRGTSKHLKMLLLLYKNNDLAPQKHLIKQDVSVWTGTEQEEPHGGVAKGRLVVGAIGWGAEGRAGTEAGRPENITTFREHIPNIPRYKQCKQMLSSSTTNA